MLKHRPSWKKTGLVEQSPFAGTQGKKREFMNCGRRGKQPRKEYKDVARSCREKIRKSKAQLELNLATAVKDNKTWFYKYINNKRRENAYLHLLLDVEGNTVTKDEEKARGT